MRIYLIGFMGVGKSHWGKILSEKLKLRFFDLDQQIQQYTDRTIVDIFATEGEEDVREVEKECLQSISNAHSQFVMSCGGGTPCYFNNIDFMKSQGVVVWLDSSLETIFTRLKAEKAKRPLIRELNDSELREFILRKIADRKIYYEQSRLRVEEDLIDTDSLIKAILHA